MSKIEVGKAVPDFKLAATGGQDVSLSSLKGKPVVLYFYPKDDTPGCTTESCGFRDHHAAFRKAGAVVLGVSRDAMASHEKFKAKYEFPFDLLSDADEKLCRLFDVIREKNMYGKKVMGVERSTFLIDGKGVLRQEWRKVKVDGHVEAVLAAVKAL
jgi:thioredoxin-dependent peroxiredoxin